MRIHTAAQLGAAVRARRNADGLTQAALASRAGISRRTLIAIEQGHPAGEIGRVLDVLHALGLDIELAPAPSGRDGDETDLLDVAGQGL
ncbi:helix-turn-helix domain-containing protein [Cellulomonas sp. 179-A 4D5 NHS]|uniref:helix-turn-helix domain-containing protein n=1 Tax=Cellulomonas sp. 179-A 4D5 NHS TaxID=3142378 RepID=UPI00399F0C0A